MITITLYTRPGCHLCEQVKDDLYEIQSQIPHQIVEVDIDSDPILQKKYLTQIPVLEAGSYLLRAPISKIDLLVTLGALRDSNYQNIRASQGVRPKMALGDRFSYWLTKHWLFAVNALFILYLGLPMAAPGLMKVGASVPANVIYFAYSPLCHQLGFRSFFLFGEQAYYPREQAGIKGVKTYKEATGLDENDLISARAFKGNEQVGYKIALCERDVAIYGAIILFGFLFGLTGKSLKPLHWAVWLLCAIAPIAFDGFSQLFSQLPFSFISAVLPFRESTPLLRVVTGFLFGFGTAWFGLPYVEESMQETKELIESKFFIKNKVENEI